MDNVMVTENIQEEKNDGTAEVIEAVADQKDDLGQGELIVQEETTDDTETVVQEETKNASEETKSSRSGKRRDRFKIDHADLENLDMNIDQFLRAPETDAYTLEDYEKLREDGTIFQQTFTTIDRNNTMYAFMGNDIRLKMTSKNIDGFYHDDRKIDKIEALNKKYNVIVLDVDREARLVYVSANAANEEPRKQVRNLLDEGIEKKKYKIVPAKVIGVSPDKDRTPGREVCLLNIGGLGIMGSLRLRDWSRCFTPSFNMVAHVGDIVKVAVIGQVRWSTVDDPVYVCSRKLLLPEDPWKDIGKKLHEGAAVRVLCTDKKQAYFFGKIEGFEDINALCYYPKHADYEIEVGKKYIGWISKVSESRKDLVVSFPRSLE